MLSLTNKPILCLKCYKNLKPTYHKFEIKGVKGISLFKYEGDIKKLIFQFKKCEDYGLKDVFLLKFKNYINIFYSNYVIIPIPSSKSQDKKRGYNHVEAIYSSLKLKIIYPLKKKTDENQKDKTFEERIKTKDMFSFDDSIDIKNKNILLVDDVCTTGTSLKNAVSLLKTKNPRKIKIIVIAKRELTEEEISKFKDKSLIVK